jgi:hypothetical protein
MCCDAISAVESRRSFDSPQIWRCDAASRRVVLRISVQSPVPSTLSEEITSLVVLVVVVVHFSVGK